MMRPEPGQRSKRILLDHLKKVKCRSMSSLLRNIDRFWDFLQEAESARSLKILQDLMQSRQQKAHF
jgi:hypothetical protein